MNLVRNRFLLVVALTLAVVKFLILPWLDHQREAAANLAVMTKRLDRSVVVVRNREAIVKSVSQLEAALATERQRFPTGADPQGFRIGVQQSIGAAATQAGLSVRAFEWVVDGEVRPARLVYSRARVLVSGGFRSLVGFQSEIEGRFPNAAIRELNLSATTAIASPDESQASLTLVVDFHFRPASEARAP